MTALARLGAAAAAALVLVAGCGSGSAAPGPTGGAAPSAPSLSGSAPDVADSPSLSPNESTPGSTPRGTDAGPSSRQTAITVVAPTTPTTPTSSTSPAPATTTDPSPTAATSTHPTSSSRSTSPATTASTTRASSSTSEAPPPPSGVKGRIVVIDPGHNGQNAAHPEIINKQVPAGFGEYKNCNTTGTATNAGYAEHRFNWQVGLAVRDALQAKGITVVLTRDSDDGVGPCVNKRAAIGNATYHGRKADAVVSIHGDGEAAGVRGFYVMTASRPPAGKAVEQQTEQLALAIRDGLSGARFPISNTLGTDGIWQRGDLAGLNLSERPTVMIECGNMRNAHEAELMSSAAGQQRYAQGIADGIVAYLAG